MKDEAKFLDELEERLNEILKLICEIKGELKIRPYIENIEKEHEDNISEVSQNGTD